jgi:L-ascorbate metabolism protein UlaG (beta-lactamase superfamily)
MKATWLGQSGYLFESNGKRLLIDPFYSDIVEQKQGIKRLVEAPIPMRELKPDIIFITHNHLDHFDPIALPEIHELFPQTPIVGPESVILLAKEMGFDESILIELPKGSKIKLGEFEITSTAAYHSDPFAVGCLIKTQSTNMYYSGDTLLTETLLDEIKSVAIQPLDVMFIIINGKLGNMNVDEAIELTKGLHPKLAIPMHYGMFKENTADPVEFTTGCDIISIPSKIMDLGQTTEI